MTQTVQVQYLYFLYVHPVLVLVVVLQQYSYEYRCTSTVLSTAGMDQKGHTGVLSCTSTVRVLYIARLIMADGHAWLTD